MSALTAEQLLDGMKVMKEHTRALLEQEFGKPLPSQLANQLAGYDDMFEDAQWLWKTSLVDLEPVKRAIEQ